MKFIKMLFLLFLFFSVSTVLAGLLPKIDYGDKIAVIPIKGAISFTDSYSGVSAEKVIQYLNSAEKEPTIKAVLLDINSGGGAVVASKQVMEKVSSMEKPVVSVINEVGASGAYWIASSSDKIVADHLSITGSVGVIGSYLEFAGLIDDYNISRQRLVGGQLKDLGDPFREMSEVEKGIMQEKINMIHKYFLDSVKENRNLTSLSGIRTGVYYLGGEAKILGLVDYLGDKELAVKITNELAGTEDANLVEFKAKKPLLSFLNQLAYDFGFNLRKGVSESYVESDIVSLV